MRLIDDLFENQDTEISSSIKPGPKSKRRHGDDFYWELDFDSPDYDLDFEAAVKNRVVKSRLSEDTEDGTDEDRDSYVDLDSLENELSLDTSLGTEEF